jgi:hypothetical protein
LRKRQFSGSFNCLILLKYAHVNDSENVLESAICDEQEQDALNVLDVTFDVIRSFNGLSLIDEGYQYTKKLK